MTALMITAAVLTLATLLVMLRPLVFARAGGERKRRNTTAAAVALGVAAVATGLYAFLGNPAAMEPQHAGTAGDPQVERMVAALAARLEREPTDTKGWIILARSYKVMGRTREAEQAYDRAGSAIDKDAQELANYADVVVSNANGRFAGKPALILEKAMRVDPQNPMVLWLSGAAALDAGDKAGAVKLWQKLLALLPPESDDARELRGQIVQAGGVAPEPAGPLAAALAPPAAATKNAPAAPAAAAAVPGASVTGRLDLAPGLAAAPADVVFIIARAPGQRIPVAVIRTTVSQLPRDFKLDDTLAMSLEARISTLREVQVEARVSKSGDPAAKAGDLVSETQTVAVGATGVALRISRVKAP